MSDSVSAAAIETTPHIHRTGESHAPGAAPIQSGGARKRAGRWGLWVEAAFLLLALAPLFVFRDAAVFRTMSVVFVGIVLEAFPFMLVGALVGGFIEVFVPREKVAAILPARGARSVFLAGLLGVIFPVCECAVVPVVRRLLRKGVPFSAAIAYLLAGPIVNPIVAASTAVAYNFNWQVVALRVGAGYLVAVTIGNLMGLLFRKRSPLLPYTEGDDACETEACCDHDHDHDHDHGHEHEHGGAKIGQALRHAAEDFIDIGRFLVIGALIAALIQTIANRGALVAITGNSTLSIVLMMAMAVMLNLCSEADAFVAVSFRAIFPLTSQLSFMVLGPMLDIKLLLMYLGLFRKRAIVTLACAIVLTVFAVMALLSLTALGRM